MPGGQQHLQPGQVRREAGPLTGEHAHEGAASPQPRPQQSLQQRARRGAGREGPRQARGAGAVLPRQIEHGEQEQNGILDPHEAREGPGRADERPVKGPVAAPEP